MEHLEKVQLTNFTTPMQVVQMIPMFVYINTLSNFLITEHLLNETDRNQSIPIVNALFTYVFRGKQLYFIFTREERKKIANKRMDLARKLIQGTGLYGAKENEILDEKFVDSLYKHIITTLVFEKYTNVYGFLAEIVRNSDDVNLQLLDRKVYNKLAEETFLIKDDGNSISDFVTIADIIIYFIGPLLPHLQDMSLLATDYVYVQAGSIFLDSVTSKKILLPVGINNLKPIDTFSFEKYSLTGHAIEQSVATGEMDSSALSAFALPALLRYVYNHKQELKSQSTKDIINNSTLVTEALCQLFTYLNETYEKLENAQRDDYRYKMSVALSNFKNRTTLAKETLKKYCLLHADTDLDKLVEKYKEDPDKYPCDLIKHKVVNLNKLYEEQVNHMGDKYITYEKESIKELFGPEFIEAVDTSEVKIYKIKVTIFNSQVAVPFREDGRETDDLLKFEFVNTGKSALYAILRNGLDMTLMRMNDTISGCSAPATVSNTTEPQNIIECNKKNFYKKLNIQYIEPMNFYDGYVRHDQFIKKNVNQKFDTFLNEIARERGETFKSSLKNEGYDATSWELWRETLASIFIPFYDCYKVGSGDDNMETLGSCILDVVSLASFAGKIGSFAGKLTFATRNILRMSGTTIGALAVRMTMRETLKQLATTAIKGAGNILLKRRTYLKLGVGVLRFLDPGFEFLYKIGKGGFKMMISSLKSLEKFRISFPKLIKSLTNTEKKLLKPMAELPNHINGGTIYVNSLSSPKAGYGYPFIQVNDEIVHIRKVEGVENGYAAAAYYRDPKNNKITWSQINPETGKTCKANYNLVGGMFL